MGTKPGELAQDQPLYRTIHACLAEEIAEGVFPLGSKLPSEHELCQRFSASRHTVRDALRQLQDDGIIFRRRGSGSMVISRFPPQRFVSSVNSIDALMQYVAETRLEILTTDKIMLDEVLGRSLDCAENTVWLRISALRRAENANLPFAYTEIYIAESYAGVADDVGTVSIPVYQAIEQRYGVRIAKVHQTIEATSADRNLASRLGVEIDCPILRVARRYVSAADEMAEIAINYHPAKRFQYDITLEQQAKV